MSNTEEEEGCVTIVNNWRLRTVQWSCDIIRHILSVVRVHVLIQYKATNSANSWPLTVLIQLHELIPSLSFQLCQISYLSSVLPSI